MNGAKFNYDFQQKNNWRRWQWNRISEMMRAQKMPPLKTTVLYLGGRDALDIQIAYKHGIREENMICVEWSKEVAAVIRRNGHNTICSSLSNVAENWDVSMPVNIILADFCSGISKEVLRFACNTIINPAFWNCIVAANLMRGRESNFADIKPVMELITEQRYDYGVPSNHRGLNFYAQVLGNALNYISMLEETDKERAVPWRRGFQQWILKDPSLWSYRSGNLTFDSVVLLNPHELLLGSISSGFDVINNYAVRQKLEESLLADVRIFREGKNQDEQRKIAAAKAIRTMRINKCINN